MFFRLRLMLLAYKKAKNNKKEIIQTPSKVSEFDLDEKDLAILLTEMLKVKCKDIMKSSLPRSARPFCCSAQFRPYLFCSKPVKPGHYRAFRSHILRVLLTKIGKKWRNSGIIKLLRCFSWAYNGSNELISGGAYKRHKNSLETG